jgi:hypothetical protein
MIARTLLAGAALAFLALLGTTLANQGLDGTEAVTGSAWGRVTLADFYLGVACFALVIHAVERQLLVTIGWTLALAPGGYPVAVLWLLLRGLPRLEQAGALSREQGPPEPN